jgi:hypothetical protein
LASYRSTLETYGKREQEFAPNSQLYREIQERKFTIQALIKFHEQRSDKGWPDSADGILSWLDHHQSILEAAQQGTKVPVQFKDQLNTAIHMQEDHRADCRGKETAGHQVGMDENYVFFAFEDTLPAVLEHMYYIGQQSGKNVVSLPPCDWRESECSANHLMRDCPVYKALSNEDKLSHIMKSKRCLNCYKRGHRAADCPSNLKCITPKLKHSTALHQAWKEKKSAVAF